MALEAVIERCVHLDQWFDDKDKKSDLLTCTPFEGEEKYSHLFLTEYGTI